MTNSTNKSNKPGRKITQEEFCAQVHPDNKKFIIGLYSGRDALVSVTCDKGHVTWIKPVRLKKPYTCSECTPHAKRKTNEQFLKDLAEINANITPLQEYTTSSSPILCRCDIDGYEWLVRPYNLLYGKKCPMCSGKVSKTHEEVVKIVKELSPHLEILSKHTTSSAYLEVFCTKHELEFKIAYKHLVRGYGCVMCSNERKRKTHDEYVKQVAAINPNIEVTSRYETQQQRVAVKCRIDGFEWSTIASSLLQGRGCPKCSKSGYDPSLQGILYVYDLPEHYGFGITNNLYKRDKTHRKSFKDSGVYASLVKQYVGDGRFIQNLETHLKKSLPISSSGVPGFRTESVLKINGALLFDLIHSYYLTR